jgi:uncharacterized membrane protein
MRPRWLIVGLVASLALNLFLIGADAGVIALGVRMAREGSGVHPAFFFRATQQLSQPARRDFRRMLIGLGDEVRPALVQSRAERLQAWNGLTAAQPDTAAIKQSLAQSRAADIAVRAKVEEAIVERAARLPQAERLRLVDGFRRASSNRGAPPAP